MSFGQFRSLQVRLAVRLAVLYVAAAAIAVGVLVYQVYDTAGSLNDRELGLRAEDLARALVADGTGQPRLDLPAKLAASTWTRATAGEISVRFCRSSKTIARCVSTSSAGRSRFARAVSKRSV